MSVSQLVVIDFSENIAGAYCAKMLADYGSDVVKVEPLNGDPIRRWGPFPKNEPHPARSGLFTFLNTNKRGITLDLDTPEDQDWLRRLVSGADVLIESFRPNSPESSRLDVAELLRLNPHLVIASITDFGQSGPYKGFQATELTLEAVSGWMAGNGDPGQPPLKLPGNIQAELYGALVGVVATLGAVRQQRSSGLGQHVDISVMESVIYTLPNVTTVHEYSGENWTRHATYPPTNPPGGIYQCEDGPIGSSAVYQSEWAGFCSLIGRLDLVDDPRFKTRADRIKNATALTEIIADWMSRHSAKEVYKGGQKLRVPIAQINSPRDLFESEQLASRGFWTEVDQPSVGRITMPGAPYKLPASPWKLRRLAPLLGEHNDILTESGGRWNDDRAAQSTVEGLNGAQDSCSVPAFSASAKQPLAGVRVLDLCMAWAGPLATRLLAELGAEVIKIEGPQHMDRWRGGSIPSDKEENYPDRNPGLRPYNRYALANTQNTNKLSLVLDLKHPSGKDIFKRLVCCADLVMENFSAGALARLGLDYDVLRNIKPDIILASLPSFGRTGPERDYVGHANFVEDTAGNTFLFGYPAGPPLHTGTAWGDPLAGVTGAAAAMMALLHRESTGEGQHVDLAHVEAAIPFNVEAILDFDLNGHLRARSGNFHPTMAPHGCYRSRSEDTWVTIAIRSQDEWRALVNAMGNPAWAQDTRFTNASDRQYHRDELDRYIESWTCQIDHIEAMLLLQSHGIAAGAVLRASDLCVDPHLKARDFLVEVTHPEAGTHRYPRQPWLFSRTPPQTKRPAPCFGQDNRYVLNEILKLTDEEIAELEVQGVVGSEPVPQYGV